MRSTLSEGRVLEFVEDKFRDRPRGEERTRAETTRIGAFVNQPNGIRVGDAGKITLSSRKMERLSAPCIGTCGIDSGDSELWDVQGK